MMTSYNESWSILSSSVFWNSLRRQVLIILCTFGRILHWSHWLLFAERIVVVVVFNRFYLKVVQRWQRNRMGRPLSSLQIHQKIIWMLSNFHKTTSEHWWRTPGPQKGSPVSSKEIGQNIKDKNRDKRFRDVDPSWGGSHEGEVSTH